MHHRIDETCRRRRFARDDFGQAGARRGRHGHGHSHGHGHGRGGRSGRIFDHGELRLVVLALIAERPRHGYELIKEIEERLGGSYSPSPGVIYPNLTMLEELGHATVAEQDGKKLYAVTEAGRAWLADRRAAVDAVMARMEAAAGEAGGGPAPQLIRAMENLKTALRLRQRGGPLGEDELRRIVEILDGAAVAIERA